MRRIGSADGHAALDVPALLTDNQLMVQVTSRLARCAGADVDADEWFPVATRWGKARAEAARALALCAACPVRAECLELSLRQWSGAGRYGVWGGLLEAERATARKHWLAGVTVAQLLAASHEGCSSGGHEEAARESGDLPAKRAAAMRHSVDSGDGITTSHHPSAASQAPQSGVAEALVGRGGEPGLVGARIA